MINDLDSLKIGTIIYLKQKYIDIIHLYMVIEVDTIKQLIVIYCSTKKCMIGKRSSLHSAIIEEGEIVGDDLMEAVKTLFLEQL